MGIKDFIILGHIYLYCDAMLVLAFKHPDPVVVGAIVAAVPTLLGFTHWFLIKDDKTPDAPR